MQAGNDGESDLGVREQERSNRRSEYESVRRQPEAEIDQEVHGGMAENFAVHLADGSEGEPAEVHIDGPTTTVSIGASRSNEGGDRSRRGMGREARHQRERLTRGNRRGVFEVLASDV